MEWHELCEIRAVWDIWVGELVLRCLGLGLSLERSGILIRLGEHQRIPGRTLGLGEHQWEYPEIETRWYEFLEGSSILVCLGEHQRTPGRTPGLGEHQWECVDIEIKMSWVARLGEYQRIPGRTSGLGEHQFKNMLMRNKEKSKMSARWALSQHRIHAL